MVSICYCIMLKASIQNLHRYSLIVAMGYLILCQVSRVYIFNYGLLSTDFSGPLMIITQKITTVAFQVHDGLYRKDEELTSEQQRLAVKARPTLLEYLSYNLNFLSILAGPCSNYKDYISFIEGRHIAMKLLERNWKPNGYNRLPEPSPAMRNNFRHHFLSSRTKKVIYDIITWAVTQLSICYTVGPFLLLAVEPTFKFYKSMYFYFHILSILVLLVLPIKPNSVKSQVHTSNNNNDNNKKN
ncbi:UNVERIFIED_CONTAM: hypothetical protein FKN15_032433 [Acipenser sinensis]